MRGLNVATSRAVQYFWKDASIVVMTLAALFFVMTAVGNTLPILALLLGASVGLTAAAARSWRRTQEDHAAASKRPRQGR